MDDDQTEPRDPTDHEVLGALFHLVGAIGERLTGCKITVELAASDRMLKIRPAVSRVVLEPIDEPVDWKRFNAARAADQQLLKVRPILFPEYLVKHRRKTLRERLWFWRAARE